MHIQPPSWASNTRTMARLKVLLLLGISYAASWNTVSTATVPSPAPSIDIFFPPLAQDATNQSAGSSTIAPSISERIHASLHNVLRIPLPLWGTVSASGSGTPTLPQAQQQQQPSQTFGESHSPEQYQRKQLEQQQHPQQIGVFGQPGESQGAPLPASFLPDVNQAIHSTIAQLSTLTHWPFGYVTTSRPQQQQQQTVQTTVPTTTVPPKQPSVQQTTPALPKTTTIAATTVTSASAIATEQTSTSIPTTPIPVPPPLPPASPTQFMTAPPPSPSLPQFISPPSKGESSFPFLPPLQAAPTQPPRQSLPNRIHNRIHATLNNYNIRLPNLNHIGQNRPLSMITEPPWVTELLGPTLEPPTTRAPTIGERVQNSIQNVLLFVPATLLNFWYQNWGTQQVDRFISRLQLSTPKPGSPASPVFATISQQGPNPFANFTASSFGGDNSSSPVDLPAIAAFINSNGTLMPTIVHPVVNMTANTIEYQLRGENETTVLWTGTLSNDVFFGNKQSSEGMKVEDDEDEQIVKKVALNVLKEEE